MPHEQLPTPNLSTVKNLALVCRLGAILYAARRTARATVLQAVKSSLYVFWLDLWPLDLHKFTMLCPAEGPPQCKLEDAQCMQDLRVKRCGNTACARHMFLFLGACALLASF